MKTLSLFIIICLCACARNHPTTVIDSNEKAEFPAFDATVSIIDPISIDYPFGKMINPDDPTKVTTQLTPALSTFTIGKAMRFSLELVNDGENAISYFSGTPGVCHPLTIKNSNNENVLYIGGCPQSDIGKETLQAGRSCVLLENHDISQDYYITKPGTYTFEFTGQLFHPDHIKTNTVRMLIQAGEIYPAHTIVQKLIPILPKDWHFSYPYSYSFDHNGTDARFGRISLHSAGDLLRDIVMIDIIQSTLPLENLHDLPLFNPQLESLEYLGKSGAEFVYIKIDPRYKKAWPQMISDIKRAMHIN